MHSNLSVSFSPESQAVHHAMPFFSARQQLQTVCFLIAPCSSNFDLHRFILSYDRQRTYILLDIRQVVSCKKEQSGAFLCRSGPDRWVWCGIGHPAEQPMHTEPKTGGGLRAPRRSRQSSQLRPLYLHVDRLGI